MGTVATTPIQPRALTAAGLSGMLKATSEKPVVFSASCLKGLEGGETALNASKQRGEPGSDGLDGLPDVSME